MMLACSDVSATVGKNLHASLPHEDMQAVPGFNNRNTRFLESREQYRV